MQNSHKTILIIEDNVSLSSIIQFNLAKKNYNVVIQPKAELALEYLENNTPDLIWLDCYLPGMSGPEFLKTIRSTEKFKKTPVIVVTCSHGVVADIEDVEKLEISGFFVKSEFEISDIIDKVTAILEENAS